MSCGRAWRPTVGAGLTRTLGRTHTLLQLQRMNKTIEIRSARDGVALTLSNFVWEDRSVLAESFLVSIKNYEVQAETRASSFMAPSLRDYFQDIATCWRGWEGEKRWATLEGELELTATADKTGHIRLAIFLRAPYTGYHWELRSALELEAGQLDSIASNVSAAWPA